MLSFRWSIHSMLSSDSDLVFRNGHSEELELSSVLLHIQRSQGDTASSLAEMLR